MHYYDSLGRFVCMRNSIIERVGVPRPPSVEPLNLAFCAFGFFGSARTDECSCAAAGGSFTASFAIWSLVGVGCDLPGPSGACDLKT